MSVVQSNISETAARLRAPCAGVVQLDARIEDWLADVYESGKLPLWLDDWGSPLNVLCEAPFRGNVAELETVASDRQLDFEVYFARKANKCLRFVDVAREIGCGVDVASEPELAQVLDRTFPTRKIVCTAAIKSETLIRLCVKSGVLIVVDNSDELSMVRRIANDQNRTAEIALRISGFVHEGEKLFSRFGFDVNEFEEVVSNLRDDRDVCLAGLHFHLDGYCRRQRVTALGETLRLVDLCRDRGLAPQFIDMGGGIPMNYLEHETQWQEFWEQHRLAILGQREPITYRNHALGLTVVDDCVYGQPKSYPYYQSPGRADWLAEILDADCDGRPLSSAIRHRRIQLRCEPGRSILDGCGMTVARVDFRKQHQNGDWLIGVSMNRTQCRTSSDDFLVDPILLRGNGDPKAANSKNQPIVGYLVGAYCTEGELISLRKLRFPFGVEVGDLVAFPNTAGYLMHFLESRSHQFPLGKNVFVDALTGQTPLLDPIDQCKEGTTP